MQTSTATASLSWPISALGLLILFAAFTGHCNACGYGFERDYLGDIVDQGAGR